METKTSTTESSRLMSAYEKTRINERKRVMELEAQSVRPKHWSMIGEVKASDRPKNSLLDMDLRFESSLKTKRVETEERSKSILESIRSRILADQFDDVEWVAPPQESKRRDKPAISSEKSKESLSAIYEKDYMTAFGLNEEKEVGVKTAVRESMHDLMQKLDALTNFDFAAKHASDLTVKPVRDAPALDIEEKIPFSVSEAAMKAPEEILSSKSFVPKDAEEETQLDRKRKRRRNKERAQSEQSSLPSSVVRKKKQLELEKDAIQKKKSVEKAEKHERRTTSTSFFTQLEGKRKGNEGKVESRKRRRSVEGDERSPKYLKL